MRILYVFLAALLYNTCFTLSAQSNEFIQNPSFEDTPRQSRPPHSWEDCSFMGESAVDVHGPVTSFYGIEEVPADGNSFL